MYEVGKRYSLKMAKTSGILRKTFYRFEDGKLVLVGLFITDSGNEFILNIANDRDDITIYRKEKNKMRRWS